MTKIASDSASPVFIVGPPRSGTSLLSAILGSHSRIACGPETDLFRAIPLETAVQIVREKDWRQLAVLQLKSILYPDGKSMLSHFGLTEQSINKYLCTQEPTASAIYSAIPAAFAYRHGKVRWAEKTPRHIMYADTIRLLYPDAKIIRIIRDPRDSIPSVVKNIGLSKSFVGEFYRWMSVYEQSEPFFRDDSGSVTVRYEDLVVNPSKEVGAICKFIGEDFEPEMLERSGADLVRVETETWKGDIDKRIDADCIYDWKRKLNHRVAKAGSIICYEALEVFRYPEGIKPNRDIKVFPLGENFGVVNESFIIDSAQNGIRYSTAGKSYPTSISEAFVCHQDVLIGDLPLGKGAMERVWNSMNAILRIISRFVRGTPVKVDPNIQLGVGTLSRVVTAVALRFGHKMRIG
ncbi:sulfotransferase [Microbulbifer sp. Q7]|uniref:sulfotransferase family protein n=1 Tax=Microbulbifer sp. Q7 TaxID=1785091 RepID=UPI0009EDA830|nr:sulfotransferase [Microbulbifer sp. Q7]